MGVGEFFKAIAQVIGWGIMVLSFALYITYRDSLESLPKIIVFIGIVVVLFIGLVLILIRNTSRFRQAKKENEVVEKVVHITPIDDLKIDILALVAFCTAIGWVLLSGTPLDGNDLAQASIAFIAVMLVRKVYREKFY